MLPTTTSARRTALRAMVLLAATGLSTGCASPGAPAEDARFGEALRVLRAQQLIDAAAPQRDAARLAPTDGRTLREAADRLLDSFKSPPVTNVINIGVGGGGRN